MSKSEEASAEGSKSQEASAGGPVRSVDRALSLLCCMKSTGSTLTELALLTDIPLPTTLRLMRTLEHQGFVQRRDDGAFMVGPTAMMLAYQADPTGPLRWTAHQLVKELSARTQETAAFFVRRSDEIICVESVESTRPIRWVCPRGSRSKSHETLPGRLLLAYSPWEGAINEPDLVNGKFTSRSGFQYSPDDLNAELERIRTSGVATSDFVGHTDAWGFALPFAPAGVCIGAFAVVGPFSRTGPRRHELIETAQSVLENLGRSLTVDMFDEQVELLESDSSDVSDDLDQESI